jgi:hypothetical protein
MRFSPFLLLLLVIALGILAGVRLVHWCSDRQPLFFLGREVPWKLILASLTAGTLLSFIKDVWAAFVSLQRLAGGVRDVNWAVAGEATKVFLTVVGFTFAVITIADETGGGDGRGFLATTIVVGADEEGAHRLGDRLLLPYFNQNVAPDANLSCEAKADILSTLDKGAEGPLLAIACGLRMCSTKARRVRIDVQGFASSSNLNCPGKSPADANLELAELRRTRVVELLNGSLAGAPNCDKPESAGILEIDPEPVGGRWEEDYEAMVAARDFTDIGPIGVANRSREVLTRRVDVVVIDRGACAR